LVLHGMQPGPQMLVKNAVEIYSLIWALTGACIISSFIGLMLARPLAKLTRIDVQLLAPIIIAVSYAGSYAIDLEIENVIVTTVFAAIGYLMIRFEYPRLPLVIAIVLGSIAERNFRQSMMMSDGDWSIYLQRGVSLALIALIVISLVAPRFGALRRALSIRRGPAVREEADA
jgi:putative tricarboxylic transport membrane protein